MGLMLGCHLVHVTPWPLTALPAAGFSLVLPGISFCPQWLRIQDGCLSPTSSKGLHPLLSRTANTPLHILLDGFTDTADA